MNEENLYKIKDRNPIYYKDIKEMDRNVSDLVEELRGELSGIRGKFFDIKMTYGFEDRIEAIEGLLTCGISALYNTKEDFLKLEKIKLDVRVKE